MRDPGSDVGRYLGGLDGLRGVACMMVLVAHCIGHFAPTATPNGVPQVLVQGMTVFFVLSGTLIYLPFVKAIVDPATTVQLVRYARRRILRVFPAYLVIFGLSNFVFGAAYVTSALSAPPLSAAGTGRITDAGDVLLQLSLIQGFLPSQMQLGIPPAWSLTTELTFYLALPLAALAVTGRRGSRIAWALVPPMLFLLIGLIGRFIVTQWFATAGMTVDEAEFGSNALAVLTRSFGVFADSFAFGMAIAVLFTVTTERGTRWTARRANLLAWTLIVLGAVGGTALLWLQHWYLGTLTGIAAAGLILLIGDAPLRGRTSWVSRVAGVAPLRYVGEISLSIYLWHVPVIVLVLRTGWFGTDSLSTLFAATGLVMAITVALSSMTYGWVERPAMRWASKAQARTLAR